MPFKRFVETGRIALITDGPSKGKLVSIIDVIDQTRVLIDGPETGVRRGGLRLNQLQLTNFRIKFPYTAPTSIVRKAWAKYNVNERWANSTWAKKLLAKEKRQTLTDFDRFKLGKARIIRNKMRTRVFNRMKNIAAENGTLYGKHKMSKKQREKYLKKGDAKPKTDKKQAKPKKAVKAK
ncbi:60S ribosomal protein L14 [Photinus pyralis]|uniref:60S ribosomal protein L14 n=1 Tax=Photinus pyralis TaxID=7054 RepID=UPI0012677AE8|nr:60S ribosomal protein L14 [Photinus pyralis]